MKSVLLHAGAIFLLTAGLIAGLEWYLHWYTRQNEFTVIPPIRGLPPNEALMRLSEAGLVGEIVDSYFVDTLNTVQILSSFPAEGNTVKPGRKVFLTRNILRPPRIPLPAVLHLHVDAARRILQQIGFQIQRIHEIPAPAEGAVLRVLHEGKDVAPGKLLPRHASLELFVGKVVPVTVRVPDYRCLTLADFSRKIWQDSLIPGLVQWHPDSLRGFQELRQDSLSWQMLAEWRIRSQNPPPGALERAGTSVDVLLTSPPESGGDENPCPWRTPDTLQKTPDVWF